nr:TMEM175 family protein [Vagococcus fluvialis]
MSKSRFEAFTDAIIAIVMTILVLNLDLPKIVLFLLYLL